MDTSLDASRKAFPQTQWSAIAAAADSEPDVRRQGLEMLCRRYWRPLYQTVRIAWAKSNEDAKDLTQAFLLQLFENEEKLKDFDRHAKELESRLNEAARTQDNVNDEKVKLQEAVAKVESEHSRQLETWRRKLNLVRNDMEGRINSLQTELDAVRGENAAMKSAGPVGWLRRLTGGDKPQPPAPPR